MNKPSLINFAKTVLYIGATGYGGPAIALGVLRVLISC